MNYTPQIMGGLMIGSAAILVLLFMGRIAGISGIFSNWLRLNNKLSDWRLYFLTGLLIGPILFHFLFSMPIPQPNPAAWPQTAFAGFLVGLGTVLGGGCTSGHGVCGIARISPRSLIATLVFVLVAALVVALIGVPS